MKQPFTFLLALFIVLNINAQSIDQIKADRNTYIWGEGSCTTLKTADIKTTLYN